MRQNEKWAEFSYHVIHPLVEVVSEPTLRFVTSATCLRVYRTSMEDMIDKAQANIQTC